MEVVRDLRELLGRDLVSDDGADAAAHAGDLSVGSLLDQRKRNERRAPVCVVRPKTTAHVAQLLRWAHDTRTPVVPYGRGSGVCGGIALERPNSVVLDTTSMATIGEVDEKSLLVTAQAGVSGAQLATRLDASGFTLGHEPQSLAISSVGGWIATRATGQLSARYGGIERLLAGFEAVIPGGRVVRSKVSPRRVAGPEVGALMVGSEGTLGVVTEATLRVSRVVDERVDRAVSFDHMADGVAACRRIAQSDLRPTLVRLYDSADAAIFWRQHPQPPSQPLLLLSFDGFEPEQRSKAAIELTGGARVDDGLVHYWWEHRSDAVDQYAKLMAGDGVLGPHALVDTMEVAGTWGKLRDLYHSMKEALATTADFVGCHLSHVYPDGACLYFTLASVLPDDDAAIAVHEQWWERGMGVCLEKGGSISHHHGIGRLKSRWMRDEVDGWWDVLAAVKAAIDPHGIMNPGALGL